MKKNAVYLTIFGILFLLVGFLAGAGLVSRPEPLSGRRKVSFFGSPKARKGLSERLSTKLDLSSAQEEGITQILEKARQEIKEAAESFRGSVSGIKEKRKQEIMSILDSNQQEKFQKLETDLREKYRQRKRPGRRPIKEDPWGE